MATEDTDLVAQWVAGLEEIGEPEIRRRLEAQPAEPDGDFDLFQNGRPKPSRRFVQAWCTAKEDARERIEEERRDKAVAHAEDAHAAAQQAIVAARYAERRASTALGLGMIGILIALLAFAWPHLQAALPALH